MSGGEGKTIANYPVIGFLIFVDQLAKYLIRHNIPPGESIPIIKNFFHLTHVLNRGAAFGILKNQTHLFIIISIVVIIFILLHLSHNRLPMRRFALSLILAGAMGNLIDRLRLGAVIDFLDFRIWPVFNIADSAITIGAILLAFSIFKRTESRKQRTERKLSL